MRRILAFATAAVLLAGCRSPQPTWNPAMPFGPGRVPPPPTGAVGSGARTNPYYQQPTGQPQQPNYQTQPGHQQPNYQTQPGPMQPQPQTQPGFQTQPRSSQPGTGQSSMVTPQPAYPAAPANWAVAWGGGAPAVPTAAAMPGPATAAPYSAQPQPTGPNGQPAQAARQADPAEKDAAPALRGMPVNDAVEPGEPRRFVPAGNAMNITQVSQSPPAAAVRPAANAVQPAANSGSAGMMMGMRGFSAEPSTASWEEPVSVPTAPSQPTERGLAARGGSSTASTGNAPARNSDEKFGYEEDYSRLQGQLEYSETARLWKLRYIPREASERQIDEHGGSVVLSEEHLLADYQPGEYVVVEGRLGNKDAKSPDFAPDYHVARIARMN